MRQSRLDQFFSASSSRRGSGAPKRRPARFTQSHQRAAQDESSPTAPRGIAGTSLHTVKESLGTEGIRARYGARAGVHDSTHPSCAGREPASSSFSPFPEARLPPAGSRSAAAALSDTGTQSISRKRALSPCLSSSQNPTSPASSSTESYHSADDLRRGAPSPSPITAEAARQRVREHRLRPRSAYLSPPASESTRARDDLLPYGCRSVVLPWSSRNVCVGDGDQECHAWDLVDHILGEGTAEDSSGLRALLQALQVHSPCEWVSSAFEFHTLAATLDSACSSEERRLFFAEVLPWMRRVAREGPRTFRSTRVPVLRQGSNKRVLFRPEEVITLLCCSFFSLFPGRSACTPPRPSGSRAAAGGAQGEWRQRQHTHARRRKGNAFGLSAKLAPINFDSLFCSPLSGGSVGTLGSASEKIHCLLQYFSACYRVASDGVAGTVVEVSRVSYDHMPDFTQSTAPLQHLTLTKDGVIEDAAYALQVDFANKVLGGGVLGRGCVQEEIRFAISPELFLSRLVCETLGDREAVFISGCGQYASYTGYAATFRFDQPLVPSLARARGDEARMLRSLPSSGEPRTLVEECEAVLSVNAPPARLAEPKSAERIHLVPTPLRSEVDGRRLRMLDICVVAMDAFDFNGFQRTRDDQYLASWVARETQKAFVSFYGTDKDKAVLNSTREGPIATGNWGCGAFGGDVELKLLIQWCAASEAGRTLTYCVYDRVSLPETFAPVQRKCVDEGWTVGDVFRALMEYGMYRAEGATVLDSAPARKELVPDVDDALRSSDSLPTESAPPQSLFSFLLRLSLADLRARAM